MAQDRTTSLDLPPVLSQLLGPMTPPVTQAPTTQQAFNPAMSGLSSGMVQPTGMGQSFMPSYAEGGMVGAGGMPVGMGQAGVQPQGAQGPMSAQQVEMQIQQFMSNNPQQVAQIQQIIQVGLQSGELTMEDLNMMEQLAMTALQNPELYPRLRQLAIQQGFAGEQDLSPQYDEGLIITVLIAARAGKEIGSGVTVPPMGQAVSPPANFAMGGMVDDKVVRPGDMASGGGKVEGPGTGTSDSIPIRVSTGEYVIPANVVRMKGKEYFDSMVEKYKDV